MTPRSPPKGSRIACSRAKDFRFEVDEVQVDSETEKLTKAKHFRFEVDEVQVDSETEKLTKAKHFRFEVDEVQEDSETEELPVLEESESEQGPK